MPPPTAPEEADEETTPALLEEILEQIFLRLPPDEPECLVRASLTSKLWHAILSGPSFRNHHGAPPMLGFLSAAAWDFDDLEEGDPAAPRFEPDEVYGYGLYAAAVLCAVTGCDHLTCHDGPFRVVHFSLHGIAGDDFVGGSKQAYVSSMDPHHVVEWSDPCPGVSVGGDGHIEPRPAVLLNGALHFLLAHDSFYGVHYTEILKYDLSSNSLSLIDAPKAGLDMPTVSVLMAMQDSNLGFAHLKKLTLFIWSRHIGSDGVAAWTRRRVIKLKNHLPIQNPREDVRLLGSVEGTDIIFVTTNLGIYKINLKSMQHKKISNGESVVSLIPYMSFNHPREKGENP
ncbi:unnamed protein product [Alopecurus aequalis]